MPVRGVLYLLVLPLVRSAILCIAVVSLFGLVMIPLLVVLMGITPHEAIRALTDPGRLLSLLEVILTVSLAGSISLWLLHLLAILRLIALKLGEP